MYDRGIPKDFKKVVSVKEDWQTNLMIAARLSDMFELGMDVRTVNVQGGNVDTYGKALVYDALHRIHGNAVKKPAFLNALKTDMALYTLMSDYEARKRESNTARALERKSMTDKLRFMADYQREITSELLRLGLAPALVTPEDRRMFAAEAAEMEMPDPDEPTDADVAREADAVTAGDEENEGDEQEDGGELDVDLPSMVDEV